MTETVIIAEQLTKIFKRKQGFFGKVIKKKAVSDLSFEVKAGEIVAFIGPNGGGKSTTIKMLTSILYPSSGNASVLGFIPWKNREKLVRQIGVIFGQKSQLYYHLSPMDSYYISAAAYNLSSREAKSRVHELAEQFEIEDCLNLPVKNLSLGQRMRCELIASLLHRPSVLFLDEPTLGLDIEAKHLFRSFLLKQAQKEGTTVFLTSHDVGDIESLCQRILLINHGKLLLDSPLQNLKEKYGAGQVLCVEKKSGKIEEISLQNKEKISELQKILSAQTFSNVFVRSIDLETVIASIYRK